MLAVPWATILDDKPGLHEITDTPNDAEYVDDAVFMFQQQQEGRPEHVLEQLDRATDILAVEFRRIGLAINFGPGKSAAMVKLFGPRSRTLRRERLLREGKEEFVTQHGNVLQVLLNLHLARVST